MEIKEVWKDCKGYEGLYQVSNQGRVWSIRTQKCLKPRLMENGYLQVWLTAKNGKVKGEKVHRLVAIAFIENPYNKTQVNHKDENKQNNSVDNLEWMTPKENSNYGTRNEKIKNYWANHTKTQKKIKVIRLYKNDEYIGQYKSYRECERQTGLNRCSLKRWCENPTVSKAGYRVEEIEIWV